jgi:hypothetical protein
MILPTINFILRNLLFLPLLSLLLLPLFFILLWLFFLLLHLYSVSFFSCPSLFYFTSLLSRSYPVSSSPSLSVFSLQIVHFILSCDCVTIDGVWIGNWIYWPLVHTTRYYTSQITVTHRPVFSATIFTALLDTGFQLCTFLCSWAHVLAGWQPSRTNLLSFSLAYQDSRLCYNRSVG